MLELVTLQQEAQHSEWMRDRSSISCDKRELLCSNTCPFHVKIHSHCDDNGNDDAIATAVAAGLHVNTSIETNEHLHRDQ